MYISKIKIENYKGFNNHDTIELKKGINLIIGKNNSGKTAFLEALTFHVNKPHLSKENKPRASSKFIENSKISGKIGIDYQDFLNYVEDFLKGEVILPDIVINGKVLTWLTDFEDAPHDLPVDFKNKLYQYIDLLPQDQDDWGNEEYELYETMQNVNENTFIEEYSSKVVDHNKIEEEINTFLGKTIFFSFINQSRFYLSRANEDLFSQGSNIKIRIENGKFVFRTRKIRDSINSCEQIVKHFTENHIYKFDIHRRFSATSTDCTEKNLRSDNSNLVSVLHKLSSSEPGLFIEFKEKVYSILGIKDLVFIPIGNSTVELNIWNTNPIKGRQDLAISINDCGTGVGQVLAILYVVVTSTEPKVILIDEPNSFLHPSASRKLMEILTEYKQHQYFITTHSPELISNFGDNILHTQLVDGEIHVKQIEKKDKLLIQEIFEDVGVRLSDVYGYDSVFWVEGETEEKCLPLILEKYNINISNIAIVKVRTTGEFEKNINNAINNYQKLSLQENTYIPPSIGFFLDNEGKNIAELISKINIKDRENVIFTEKRLFENYLLDDDAIIKLLEQEQVKLLEIDDENVFTFSKNDISIWLEDNKLNKKYWNEKVPTDSQKENWKDKIDAAKLLHDLFKHFFESKVEYRKTKHSVTLTKILLEQNTTIFNEFVEKIRNIIKK